jgi:epoxyqueuosine reductase
LARATVLLLHGTIRDMTAAELNRLAEEVGIDVVGATPAAPYEETERHIRERRARGLFADMRFTMAQPEVSCHPERLLPGAKTVISAALCYYAAERGPAAKPPVRASGPVEGVPGNREVPPTQGHAVWGRLPRYTRRDYYGELREKLDAFGRRLGGNYRVLVDANQHVDREAAARAGVGFYGKNTMLITRRYGSWVVLGTLVSDQELEPTPSLGLDCGSCTLCIEACPTGALDEPGTVDATKCLSYWTQAPISIPEEYRTALGDQVYGCDICQDVCPWNRGIERRRADEEAEADAEPFVSLVEWLEADAAELAHRYGRLYIPRNEGRYLKRNALVALGNVGRPEHRPLLERFEDDADPLLREQAEWTLARLNERSQGE